LYQKFAASRRSGVRALLSHYTLERLGRRLWWEDFSKWCSRTIRRASYVTAEVRRKKTKGNRDFITELYILWSELSRRKLSPHAALLCAVQQWIDICCRTGPRQQTCSSEFAAVGPSAGTDGRTDRQTDAHYSSPVNAIGLVAKM